MRILITGSAGMLGSSLQRAFTENAQFEVLGLTRNDVDLRSKSDFKRFLVEYRPDKVIHAAAKVGGIQANIAGPVQFLAANLEMDVNVITSSLDREIEDFIYLGSSCMYPANYRQPLQEGDLLKSPLEPTNEGYALAKISGAKLCEYASASMGVNYKTIIPSNLYGPGDNFKPESSHLIASVIRKVHEAKVWKSPEIEVWGSGAARREFTYVHDLAEWIVGIAPNISELPNRLNVGFGKDYSVNDFYQTAMDVLRVQSQLVHDLDKPEGMKAKLLDSSLAREKHGWEPKTDLSTGILATYEWYLENRSGGA